MNPPQPHPFVDFDQLVENHYDDVLGQAFSVLGDFHRAQDVAQETFCEALFSVGSLRDPSAIGAWLRSIARHRCHRVLRLRDLELLPPESVEHWPGDQASPRHYAEDTENRQMLAGALQSLPRNERDAATLCYLKQCSQREAAAFLGVPLSTVNNRLHAARNLIKERMTRMTHQTNSMDHSGEIAANVGTITAVRGPIVDAHFDGRMPDVFDALAAADAAGNAIERLKVAQRIDNGIVRCIATGPGETLKPGMRVMNSGQVGIGLTPWVGVTPVADADLERAIKTISEPTNETIAAPPRLLETGIKNIDLFCPLTAGGSMALLGIQGVGRIVLVEELAHRLSKDRDGVRIFYLVEPNEPDSVRGMLTKEKEYPGDVVGAVQTWWMLSDRAVDPTAVEATDLFDAVAYCSPLLGIEGLFPAIDGLASSSRLLRREIVGDVHFETAERVRDTLRQARILMNDPILLEHLACRARKKAWERAKDYAPQRLAELPPEQRLLVTRARKLARFLTTPFFIAEPFNHRVGKNVTREQTIEGCRAILDGAYDQTPEEAFVFIGEIADATR